MGSQKLVNLQPAILFIEPPPFDLEFDACLLDRYECKKVLITDIYTLNRAVLPEYDLVVSIDLMTLEGLEPAILRIAEIFSVEAVVGYTELAVIATACIAQSFGLKGIGSEVARRCRNKLKMAESLTAGGVPTPSFFVTQSAEHVSQKVTEIGGFPVVCKPLMGFASFGVVRADTREQLNQAIRTIKLKNQFILHRYYSSENISCLSQVLVQAYAPGSEVAIDGYIQEGESHILSVLDKPGVSQGPFFEDAFHITPSQLSEGTLFKLEQIVQGAVTAIGLDDSPFHIEARLHEDTFTVLEIAARIGFPRCLRYSTGIDICAITLALKIGEPITVSPKWYRYSGNYCITATRLGRLDAVENRERVLNHPCIKEVPIFVELGTRVVPPPDTTGYIGFIIAQGDSYAEVEKALHWARDELKCVIK